MNQYQVVLDTNVLVCALRSQRGASAALLSRLGADLRWQANLSVALVEEYTEVIHRERRRLGLSWQDCEDFLDYICAAGVERKVYFLWRPLLSDPDDDLVLECAVASGAHHIITHNLRHFTGAERFGMVPLSPAEFLRKLRT
jgi:putative PIN family toxin of toxin-antitoxin system